MKLFEKMTTAEVWATVFLFIGWVFCGLQSSTGKEWLDMGEMTCVMFIACVLVIALVWIEER